MPEEKETKSDTAARPDNDYDRWLSGEKVLHRWLDPDHQKKVHKEIIERIGREQIDNDSDPWEEDNDNDVFTKWRNS
jgi:hypothetical protein